MEPKTVLHRLPLYVLVSLAIFMLDSCFSSFNSSEEVMAYLEKNYPGQRIVLSDEYETTRGLSNDIRIWTFTLSDYPKDTFHVASYINSYPFPMMKNQHGIIDDFEKVVILRRAKEFEHGPLKKFDALTRRLWTHFPVSDFSLKPARLELRTVDDIWRAKDLIDAICACICKDLVMTWGMVEVYRLRIMNPLTNLVRRRVATLSVKSILPLINRSYVSSFTMM